MVLAWEFGPWLEICHLGLIYSLFFFQALSNIRDFKQSLLRGIFPQKAPADTEPVGVWLVQDTGISQGITGASSYYDKPQTQVSRCEYFLLQQEHKEC